MLYFGDTSPPSASENSYKKDLVKHCMLALQTVQHKGHIIIKLKESFSLFTAGLIFMMYKLFDSVCLMKPYASDFYSTDQYLICNGLNIH